jgi:excisionase family DNA binding protein
MNIMNDDPLLSRKEAAAYLGVTLGTLETWAWDKRYDLPITKIGKKMCKYRLSVLNKFIEKGECTMQEDKKDTERCIKQGEIDDEM